MENYLTEAYGIYGILFTLLARFTWDVWKSRKKALEDNTTAIKELTKIVSDIPKIQKDLKRYFDAIKLLSGDKWSEISKKMIEEETLRG